MKTCYLLALCLILAGCAGGFHPTSRNPIGMGSPASQVEPVTTVPRHLSINTHDGYYKVEASGQPVVVVGGQAYIGGRWVDTAEAYSFTYRYTNEARWEQLPLYPNLRVAPGQVPASYQQFGIPISPPGIRH